MKNLPQGYISTLIAQKKLSGNGNSNNGSNAAVSDDYNFNPRLSDKPNFNTPDNSKRDEADYGLPLSDIINTLARKAKTVYERYLISENGKELISKANEYEIPYDKANIDFLELRDKVEEFEETIELANQHGIDWQEFGYDLLGIEQEITDAQRAESNYMSYARNELIANVGV